MWDTRGIELERISIHLPHSVCPQVSCYADNDSYWQYTDLLYAIKNIDLNQVRFAEHKYTFWYYYDTYRKPLSAQY